MSTPELQKSVRRVHHFVKGHVKNLKQEDLQTKQWLDERDVNAGSVNTIILTLI